MKKYNIVFFGTPDFAVPSLKILGENGHRVRLVVTQPDRPKGRGRKTAPPPIKSEALKAGYDLVQPTSVRDSALADRLRRVDPDFFVVVAYGGLLPANLLAMARHGAVNVHASLLPKYRGSAPIQWAIINGDAETGVTTMLLDPGMDTGDTLLSRATAIRPDDTASSLHDRLAEMGAGLLADTLTAWGSGTVTPVPQDHGRATYAPILKKSDGRIDWQAPAPAIDAFVRGMTPWPGAFTFHKGKRLKIFATCRLQAETREIPGTVVRGFSGELRVATGSGVLAVTEIQGESGKRLPIAVFLRGCPMPPGTRLD